MKQPESKELHVHGNKITCPMCNHERFWQRKTLMNTRGASFFSFDWLNRDATNYICEKCDYVLWFYNK